MINSKNPLKVSDTKLCTEISNPDRTKNVPSQHNVHARKLYSNAQR